MTSVITNEFLISATLVAEIKQSLVIAVVIRSQHIKYVRALKTGYMHS